MEASIWRVGRTVEDRLIRKQRPEMGKRKRHFSMVYNTIHENCNVQLDFSSQH